MKGFFAASVLLLALAFAACGERSAPTAASAGEAGGALLAAPAAAQDAGLTAPATAGGPAGVIDAASMDSDVIVAAQEEVLGRIYDSVQPSVVHIRVAVQVNQEGSGGQFPFPFDFDRGPREFFRGGEGSGFVWDKEGHIVTNYHVVQDATHVTVIFSDDSEAHAEILGGDPGSDLAVIKVDVPADQLHPVTLGDSNDVRVGQLAVAIGNPFGQTFTMTKGIVSAVGRTIRSGTSPFSISEVVQTDAPINPGNSGGPLLDRQGRVIGINTQIISRTGVSSGIGFSVSVNTAKRVVPALIRDGYYEYSWLGVSGSTVRPDIAEQMDLPEGTHGALIVRVTGDGPAEQAGLRGSSDTATYNGQEIPVGGDVIVAVDGAPVRSIDDLIAYLVDETKPGDRVTFDVLRDGAEQIQVEVVLGKRPSLEDLMRG